MATELPAPAPSEMPSLPPDTDQPLTEAPPATSFLYPTDAFRDLGGVVTEGNVCIIADENTRVFVANVLAMREILPLNNNLRAIACFFATATDIDPLWWVITPPIDVYTSVVLLGRLDGYEIPAINVNCASCGDYRRVENWTPLSGQADDAYINYAKMKEVTKMIAQRTITMSGQITYIP